MVTHFTELTVYTKSFELARRIFVISRRWPPERRYSLTGQIRRAARSVGANLAEAWGKRRYEAHFVSNLTDSDGENHEIEHWLLTANGDGYLGEHEFAAPLELKREVGRMLGNMIRDPEPFLLRS